MASSLCGGASAGARIGLCGGESAGAGIVLVLGESSALALAFVGMAAKRAVVSLERARDG